MQRVGYTKAARDGSTSCQKLETLCICFFLLGLWGHHCSARHRGCDASTCLTLWRDEAGGRAPVHALPPQFRRAHSLIALLHGLWAPAAARHGFPSLLQGCSNEAAHPPLWRWTADTRFHLHL